MSNDETIFREISEKLDSIIILLKLSNLDKLTNFKDQISKDKVYVKILELCNRKRNYSEIAKKTSEDLGVAEITVKKKISELTKYGIISITKSGKESFYNNTGLLDWGEWIEW